MSEGRREIIQIIGPDESADLVVCGRAVPADRLPPMFTDSVYGKCADCADKIMWRPYAPAVTKICLSCAARRVAAAAQPPQIVTTKQAIGEAILMTSRPKGSC